MFRGSSVDPLALPFWVLCMRSFQKPLVVLLLLLLILVLLILILLLLLLLIIIIIIIIIIINNIIINNIIIDNIIVTTISMQGACFFLLRMTKRGEFLLRGIRWFSHKGFGFIDPEERQGWWFLLWEADVTSAGMSRELLAAPWNAPKVYPVISMPITASSALRLMETTRVVQLVTNPPFFF